MFTTRSPLAGVRRLAQFSHPSRHPSSSLPTPRHRATSSGKNGITSSWFLGLWRLQNFPDGGQFGDDGFQQVREDETHDLMSSAVPPQSTDMGDADQAGAFALLSESAQTWT